MRHTCIYAASGIAGAAVGQRNDAGDIGSGGGGGGVAVEIGGRQGTGKSAVAIGCYVNIAAGAAAADGKRRVENAGRAGDVAGHIAGDVACQVAGDIAGKAAVKSAIGGDRAGGDGDGRGRTRARTHGSSARSGQPASGTSWPSSGRWFRRASRRSSG